MMRKRIIGAILSVCLLAAALSPVSVYAATDMAKKNEITMYVGNVRNLNPGDIKGKKTWTSSKKKVVSVAERGIITAKKKGTAVITCSKGKKSLSCTVTVLPVRMKKKAVTVKPGKVVKLKIYCGTNKGITWECSDPEVLSYTFDTGSNSVWTAKKAGSATVTATYNGKSYTTVVTVEKESIVPAPQPENPDMGDTVLPEV